VGPEVAVVQPTVRKAVTLALDYDGINQALTWAIR
jgi:hypothetical protein